MFGVVFLLVSNYCSVCSIYACEMLLGSGHAYFSLATSSMCMLPLEDWLRRNTVLGVTKMVSYPGLQLVKMKLGSQYT